MFRRIWISVVLALFVLGALSAPGRAACLTQAEYRAFSVRYLQTELMVAALSCGRVDYVERYNSFVGKFSTALTDHSRVMKQVFLRYYGLRALDVLDTYVTELANWTSIQSISEARFCEESSRLFAGVLDIRLDDLGGFSASRSDVDVGVPVCPAVAEAPDLIG